MSNVLSNTVELQKVKCIIAVFKIKAYIHKSETNPPSQFELPLEIHIELRKGES